MRTIATTSDVNDIYVDSVGNLAISQDSTAVGNIILNRIRTLQGELLLNTQEGIPYFDILYSSIPNLDLFKFYLRKTILNSDEVQKIKSLNMSIENNTLSYKCEIITNYGEMTING